MTLVPERKFVTFLTMPELSALRKYDTACIGDQLRYPAEHSYAEARVQKSVTAARVANDRLRDKLLFRPCKNQILIQEPVLKFENTILFLDLKDHRELVAKIVRHEAHGGRFQQVFFTSGNYFFIMSLSITNSSSMQRTLMDPRCQSASP